VTNPQKGKIKHNKTAYLSDVDTALHSLNEIRYQEKQEMSKHLPHHLSWKPPDEHRSGEETLSMSKVWKATAASTFM
jgi:hypothetical protein